MHIKLAYEKHVNMQHQEGVHKFLCFSVSSYCCPNLRGLINKNSRKKTLLKLKRK